MPFGRLFIGMGDLAELGFGETCSHELKGIGYPVSVRTAGLCRSAAQRITALLNDVEYQLF